MKRHETDAVSLVFGLIFAAAVAWWAIASLAEPDVDAGWIAVLALLVVGVLVLVSTLARPRRPAPVTTPVSGTPVSGTPVSGTPVSGSPVSGSPVGDTAVGDTLVSDTTASGAPADHDADPLAAEPTTESPTRDLPAYTGDDVADVDRPDQPEPGRPS